MICRFCKQEIVGPTGWSMTEALEKDKITASYAQHNECWQQSGKDNGYIARLYRALEEVEWEEGR